MEIFLSICAGIGLSAACGFRVFIPMLIAGVAAASGHLTLAPSFQWIASTPALIGFGIATALEIGAYYIPWLDNLLDSVTTPAALIAGTLLTASVVSGVDPWLQWTLAIIAGAGTTALVQSATVVTRGASTTMTGGLGNPLVSTFEWIASTFTALLTLIVPWLVFALVVVLLAVGVMWYQRRRSHARHPTLPALPTA